MAKKRTLPPKSAVNPPAGQAEAIARPATVPFQAEFDEVLRLIDACAGTSRCRQSTRPSSTSTGARRVHQPPRSPDDGWGKGTVEALAAYIHDANPNDRAISASNLWRMRQVLRDVPRPAKTRNAVARIVLEPQSGDHEPLQTRRRAGILPAACQPRDAGPSANCSASSPGPCSSGRSCHRQNCQHR